MSMTAVFLGVKKAFDTAWHPGLLYELSKLDFLASVIKLIRSFLSQRKFRVSIEGKTSPPREVQGRVSQGSVMSPSIVQYIYIYK
jgi:hypothetical protein